MSSMDESLDAIAKIWQPSSTRPLGREDALEIARNLAGYFNVLGRWAEQDALEMQP